MKYKITYESNTLPTDLPKGAEVEQLPAIPLELNGVGLFGNKRVVIRKAVVGQGVKSSSILIENQDDGRLIDVNLTKDETAQVADALLEILGLPPTAELRAEDDEILVGATVEFFHDNGEFPTRHGLRGKKGQVIEIVEKDRQSHLIRFHGVRDAFGSSYTDWWLCADEIRRV